MKKSILLMSLIMFGLNLISGCNKSQNDKREIIMYELQTSEYYEHLYNSSNNFYIDSEYELEQFYALFSDQLEINKNDLKDNTIFIQVRQVGSGSISMKLENVTFDNNNINFVVDIDYPEIGTADMSCWYLVAIVPNEELKGIALDNWIKPSNI